MPHASKLKYTQLFNTHDRNKRGFLTGAAFVSPSVKIDFETEPLLNFVIIQLFCNCN